MAAGTASYSCATAVHLFLALAALALLGSQLPASRRYLQLGRRPPWHERHALAAGGRLQGALRLAGAAVASRAGRHSLVLSIPSKYSVWEEEERALLQAIRIQPGPGAGGTGGGGGGGGGARRSLGFYFRPGACKTLEHPFPLNKNPKKHILDWDPLPDRYLLAVCRFGQLNNQIYCMMNQMVAAALSNRTLVVPPHSFSKGDKFRWQWDLAFDLANARRCLGPDSVISLAELRGRLRLPPGAPLQIDAQLCFDPPRPGSDSCRTASWNISGLGLRLAPGRPRVLGAVRFTPAEARAAFAPEAGARLLALEEMFGVFMDVRWGKAFPPLRVRCPDGNLFRAHPAIRQAAAGMSRAMLDDGRFLAVHFRRGDFYMFYESKSWMVWPEVPRVAKVLARLGQQRNISLVFVATNAHVTEIQFLIKVLKLLTKAAMKLVFLPRLADLPAGAARPWAQPWIDLGLDDSVYATAILEKLVCTHADVFIGCSGSSFSDEVYRTRWAEGRSKCVDGNFEDFED